jgi:ribonuclease P protein component
MENRQSNTLKTAFVASKKVGNAVKRNLAKRRMRALFQEHLPRLKNGSYIFVAKTEIHNHDYKKLKGEFHYCFKKLESYQPTTH